MSRRVLSALAVAAVLATGTGCSISGTDFRPGVAAQVGDQRVYTETVDGTVDDACDYFTDQGQGSAFPKAELRSEVLRLVVQREATEQLLAANDLDVREVPADTVQSFLDQNFPGASGGDQGLTDIATDAIEVQLGLSDVGTQLLQDEGTPVDPTQQDATFQRGLQALAEWLQDNDVELNPVYGLSIDDDGQITSESNDTSVVVSDEAKLTTTPEEQPSQDEQEDRQAYVDSLPSDQTCG